MNLRNPLATIQISSMLIKRPALHTRVPLAVLFFRARAQQIEMAHTERRRQLVERDDRRVAPALLQTADVLLAEAGEFGELFLRQALFMPDPTDIPPDQPAHVHAHEVSG